MILLSQVLQILIYVTQGSFIHFIINITVKDIANFISVCYDISNMIKGECK